ncbi:MAG: methyltransferase [Microscillaceae bacterium]|nr:methyltransferase [Microscillaceae bacterium]MDW8461005.1 methyltransferase [Cytophagales bacterium]
MSFRFKQFTIHQDQAAMKVCTDSCILGAYIRLESQNVRHILDIGTGTGLLALMLAQRTTAQIDAVEIDEAAFRQAELNVLKSPFASQIKVWHKAIQAFFPDKKYDLIVSNPPFFYKNFPSTNQAKNKALHQNTLTFDQLLEALTRLLAPKGIFYVLLPHYEMRILVEKAQKFGIFLQNELVIFNNPAQKPFRKISAMGFEPNVPITTQILTIKDANQHYTAEFKELLKEYYLIF